MISDSDSNDTDVYTIPIPFECDLSFDPTIEILKYIGQAVILVFGAVFNFLILWTICFKNRDSYKKNSFFTIYSIDCGVSFYIILSDLSFTRLLMYIPQICDHFGPDFWYPSTISKIIYISGHYCRAVKSMLQIFLVLNRMSCVIIPTSYTRMWRKYMNIAIFFIILLPFIAVWNIIISRVFAVPFAGGIAFGYTKRVPWASTSMFQLIFLTTALIFTIICTSITLYSLIMLPSRVKSAEKSLCIASIIISIGFLSAAVFQFLFAVCPLCQISSVMLGLQYLTFDFLNVGSPIVMILISPQLRSHLIKLKSSNKMSTTTFVKVSGTHSNIF